MNDDRAPHTDLPFFLGFVSLFVLFAPSPFSSFRFSKHVEEENACFSFRICLCASPVLSQKAFSLFLERTVSNFPIENGSISQHECFLGWLDHAILTLVNERVLVFRLLVALREPAVF